MALMYSFPNFEPSYCFMSVSNCFFLTCMQVSQEAGKVVWNIHAYNSAISTTHSYIKKVIIVH